MKQHCSCCLCCVPDCSFCDAILEVGVDATVGNCLSLLTAVLLEGVVCESSVVSMILLDSDAMISRKTLEGFFSLNCFVGGECRHQMDVAQSGEMVHKNGGGLVSLSGEAAFELSNEACLC